MVQGSSTVDRLDGVNEGIGVKAPVRAVATANITLSGEQTIDGVALVEDDRCLVTAQTNALNNGIYRVQTGAWVRALDCNGNRDLVKGSRVHVTDGTANGETRWFVTSGDPAIVIDQDEITWEQEAGGGAVDPDEGSADAAIEYVFDGAGSALVAGTQGDLFIPFDCEIESVTILADQAGDIVIDIWKDTYANYPPTDADSITASSVPAISGADKSTDEALAGWSTTIAEGSTLRFNIDSVSSIERATIALKVTLTSGLVEGGGLELSDVYPVGHLQFAFTADALPGGSSEWVRANGRTIGNGASDATERANADTVDLYTLLYNTFSNTLAPVSGGRGVSAALDYAANKTITLPDLRATGLRGVDDMGNSAAARLASAPFDTGHAATTVGSIAGLNTHTLTAAQMPAHTHSITDPGHTHDVFGEVSTIGATRISIAGTEEVGFEGTAEDAAQAAQTGITATNSAGSSAAHNNVARDVLGNWYLKL